MLDAAQLNISIHALLAESDNGHQCAGQAVLISIHALLAESDIQGGHIAAELVDFYPRSPCGERLMHALEVASTMLFLSTLSLRRATLSGSTKPRARRISIHALLAESDGASNRTEQQAQHISIHALLAESDLTRFCRSREGHNVYPRSPCGERPLGGRAPQPPQGISIHALLAESDIIIRVCYYT